MHKLTHCKITKAIYHDFGSTKHMCVTSQTSPLTSKILILQPNGDGHEQPCWNWNSTFNTLCPLGHSWIVMYVRCRWSWHLWTFVSSDNYGKQSLSCSYKCTCTNVHGQGAFPRKEVQLCWRGEIKLTFSVAPVRLIIVYVCVYRSLSGESNPQYFQICWCQCATR